MKGQHLDLEALLRVPYVEPDLGFEVSPDGKQIAFSWNPTGRWEIYVAPLDRLVSTGGLSADSSLARKITTGPGAKHAPRWSPDGGQLIYALDLDGGELYDLYVCDMATAQHVNLTPDTPDAILTSCCWSPDGRWIAFVSDRSGRFDTYVMPATGGSARCVLNLPFPDWHVRWSPDGHWLSVVAETRGQDFGTFIVPAEGGDARPVEDGGKPICAKDACWSPDSSRLAFASNLHGDYEIGLYELATSHITWLSEGEGHHAPALPNVPRDSGRVPGKELPAWSPDGGRLAYIVNHGPVTALSVFELEAGTSNMYQIEPGVHYEPSFTPDGAHVAVVFDNPRHPCDLWLLSLVDGTFRQLTCSLPDDLNSELFHMPEEIDYPSLDGVRVPALLYRPHQVSELPPGVVYIHGGPNWLTQVTWDPLVQHMVSRGWAVLAPNYRGSTGYGRAWQLASRFDLGGCDTQDVVAGADFLIQQGIVDPIRIGVTGTSWGGYLTMTSLTQYPDRWAAGSAVVPFLNWFTSHANSREDLQHWDRENFGDPEKDYDLWYARSPYFFLDRVTAPVQLICGAHDVRCPASESIQARDALVAQGKTCELNLYPDEGHGFLKTENVVDAKKRRAAFLAKHLSG